MRAFLSDLARHQRLNGARGCELATDPIPYDCDTRRRHPDALVVICRTHLVWFPGTVGMVGMVAP